MVSFLFCAFILAFTIFVNISFLSEKKISKVAFVISTTGLICGIIANLLYAFDLGNSLFKFVLMAISCCAIIIGMGKPVLKQIISVFKFFIGKDR